MHLVHIPEFMGIALAIALVSGLVGGWLLRGRVEPGAAEVESPSGDSRGNSPN